MDKKKSDWVRELAADGHIRLAILCVLSEVKGDKYVSSEYFREFFGDTPSRDIRTALHDLSTHGFLDRHSLIQYRHRQETHDARVIRNNIDILIKRGILTEPQRKTYLVIPIKLIKDHTPPEVKQEIGWQDDIEAYGKKMYSEFLKEHVIGPISQNMNFSQSVFRINDKGRQKMAEILETYRLAKADAILRQKI